jgi:hypothetical protein
MNQLGLDELTQLRTELDSLRARTADLERARQETLRRKRTAMRFGLVAVGLAALLGSGAAVAANGNCPNNLPFCFVADQPALASQVNHNFSQLKEWLEQKVGAVGTATVTVSTLSVGGGLSVTGASGAIRVQSGGTSNVSTASGKAFFLSSNMGDGQAANGGFEIRQDNLTQGVGIGFNTVYAAGSNPDQPLYLKGRGASPVSVVGNFEVSANTWGARTSSGWFSHGTATSQGGQTILCTDGQYMCGVQVGHTAYWVGTQIAIHCCTL